MPQAALRSNCGAPEPERPTFPSPAEPLGNARLECDPALAGLVLDEMPCQFRIRSEPAADLARTFANHPGFTSRASHEARSRLCALGFADCAFPIDHCPRRATLGSGLGRSAGLSFAGHGA